MSLLTHDIKIIADKIVEWQKTYGIENSLKPWENNYREELKGITNDGKPTFEQMARTFRKAKLVAYIS